VANLTLSVDDATLRAARIRALEQGTSVNALVRDYLVSYARPESAREAVHAFLERSPRSGASAGPRGGAGARRHPSARSDASSGSSGRSWTRDDLYDRRDRRHPA